MDAARTPGIFLHQYAGLPHGPAFEDWRGRAFGRCGLDIGPSHGDSIDCRLQVSVIDNIVLAIPEGASAQYSRTQSHLADGSDDLVLIAAHAGLVRVGQNGHTVELTPAQMVLVDMSITGTVGHTDEDRFTTIRMPRRALLDINPRQALAGALRRRGRRDHLSLSCARRQSRAASRCGRAAPDGAAYGRSRRSPARHRCGACKPRTRPRPGGGSPRSDARRRDGRTRPQRPLSGRGRDALRAEPAPGTAPVRAGRHDLHRIRAGAAPAPGAQAAR
ncbi:AraC-like ligand-binding domain-containing protein [Bradyrhizobium liaoningense]